jgi:hypothetical protein
MTVLACGPDRLDTSVVPLFTPARSRYKKLREPTGLCPAQNFAAIVLVAGWAGGAPSRASEASEM